MAQPQFLRDVQIVRHRQDATRSLDTTLADDHCPVVQRAVFKEDILYQPLVDVGIDHIARTHDIVQREVAFDDNQGAHLLLTHADARHDHGHDFVMLHILFLVPGKETHQRTGMLVRTQREQETPYLVLKQDNQCHHSHAHQLVENRAEQLHLQHLGYDQPDQYEYQDSCKHIDGSGSFHQLVGIVKQECNQQDIKNIFYSNIKKHKIVGFMVYNL